MKKEHTQRKLQPSYYSISTTKHAALKWTSATHRACIPSLPEQLKDGHFELNSVTGRQWQQRIGHSDVEIFEYVNGIDANVLPSSYAYNKKKYSLLS